LSTNLGTIYLADNLEVLTGLASGSANLIYIDPPFNTGKVQQRTQIRTIRSEDGDRVGFKGRRYETIALGKRGFRDLFDDYLAFLEPRLAEAHRVLAPDGTLYFHVDYREVHYCKVLLDAIFGRECFLNEVIWAYDYGGRSKTRWPPKHDNILVYTKDPRRYTFNWDDIERIPYMAPGLVGPDKAARGKVPTDTWWHTMCQPTVRRRPATPRRSLSASSSASLGLPRGRGTWFWTSSPAAAPREPPVSHWADGLCW